LDEAWRRTVAPYWRRHYDAFNAAASGGPA
jgi:hypothetical protein